MLKKAIVLGIIIIISLFLAWFIDGYYISGQGVIFLTKIFGL